MATAITGQNARLVSLPMVNSTSTRSPGRIMPATPVATLVVRIVTARIPGLVNEARPREERSRSGGNRGQDSYGARAKSGYGHRF